MEVMFRVKMDGRAVAAIPLSKDSATIICSWLAMQELMKQLSDIGAVCKRCGIVCRSSELSGEVCAAGVGCHGDSDLDLLLGLPPNVKMTALAKVIVECEGNFKRQGPTEMDGLEEPDA
jgi:hypothetical protein